MARPLSGEVLLVISLGVLLLGCSAKPPEKPIVLRPHHSERRLVRRPIPPAAASAAPLTQDEKEDLFRDFEAYLSRTAKTPENPQ